MSDDVKAGSLNSQHLGRVVTLRGAETAEFGPDWIIRGVLDAVTHQQPVAINDAEGRTHVAVSIGPVAARIELDLSPSASIHFEGQPR